MTRSIANSLDTPRAALWLTLLLAASCGGSGSSSGTSGAAGPKNLVYASNPVVYAQGVAIAANVASVQGEITSWSVAPELPAGLALDPVTGTISGTPTEAAGTASYTVRAADANGAAEVALELTVVVPDSFAISSSLADDTLSVHLVDAQTGQLRPWSFTVAGPGEEGPSSLVASADGTTIYAVDRAGDSISILDMDLSTGRLVARPAIATGSAPHELVLHPSGEVAYLSLLGGNWLQAYAVDPLTGDLSALGAPLAVGGEPKSMALGPLGKRLYVGNGTSRMLESYAIDPTTYALSTLGPGAPTGKAPLAMAVTNDGRHLFLVNARSNSLGIYNLSPVTGLPTHIEDRWVGLLPSDVLLDPTSRFVYVSVSGEDQVRAYEFDSKVATLDEVSPPVATGAQPDMLATDASGRFLYAVNLSSADVSQFAIDLVTGELDPVERSNTRDQPQGFVLLSGDAPAVPAPRFAYVSNRGSGDLSMFSADAATGALSVVGANELVGISPRGLAADPWSRFLYTVDGDQDILRSYSIGPVTGQLAEIGAPLATGAGPRALAVDRSGRFLYVANYDGGSLSRYTLDAATGVPSFVATQAAGTHPIALSIDPTGRFLHLASRGSASISTFRVDPVDGSLAFEDTLAVALEPLSLRPHPGGRFLFATFLSLGRLTVYPLDPHSGAPSGGFSVTSGTHPTAVAIDPLGRRAFATNEEPAGVGDLSTFDLGAQDAHPSLSSTVLAGVGPVDARLDPSGQFLYVVAAGSDEVHVFDVGDLAQPPALVGVWPVGVSPDSIVVIGSLGD